MVCSLQSTVCSLQSAVCGLRSAVCSLQMSYTEKITCFGQIPQPGNKTINRLRWKLVSHIKTVSFVNFVDFADAVLLHFCHYNAQITRVLPLGVVDCFDDFQRIISDRMFEHRRLKLRGFPIQTRNDKIIVIFLLSKLPVFGNFSTMFQVKVLRRSNLMKTRRWRRYRTRLSIRGITTGHAV